MVEVNSPVDYDKVKYDPNKGPKLPTGAKKAKLRKPKSKGPQGAKRP